MIRSYSQVCQRDDEDLFGALVWRHVTHDPGLVTGIEHMLDGQSTLDAGLHFATSKCSDELLRRKRWHWQVALHLLHQAGSRGGIVDHLHASLRFAVAACQHAPTHNRSVSDKTRSGTQPSTTTCRVCQPASPR